MSASNIYLIGPMGVGKSTVGRLLAAQLNLPFKDSDHVIEARTGADIPWIFDVEGEEGFRDRESAVLRDLSAERGLVLATGGGAVLREENRRYLNESGLTFYLTADVDQLLARTRKDKKRPLLQVDDPKQKIIDLLAQRDPIYRQAADFIVCASSGGPKQAVREIAAIVSAQQG